MSVVDFTVVVDVFPVRHGKPAWAWEIFVDGSAYCSYFCLPSAEVAIRQARRWLIEQGWLDVGSNIPPERIRVVQEAFLICPAPSKLQ